MLTIILEWLKVIKQLILAMKTCTTSMIMTENMLSTTQTEKLGLKWLSEIILRLNMQF